MFRIASLAIGSLLIAVGVAWFFTSILDGLALSMAGSLVSGPVTPMSKMALSDNLSLLLGGLSVLGAGLVVMAILGFMTGAGKDASAAKTS